MNESHNHSVNTSGSMKFLRISPEETLANGSKNPNKETVAYLHKKWRKNNFGCVNNPLEKLKEKTQSYAEKGISIIIHEEKPWAVLVVTPLMKRVQHLSSSKELIFCDCTSSCDTMETTLTTVLAVSNAGAVPIAMIMHEGQSSDSYKNAFGLLKKHYPLCFGGNEVPIGFMTDDSAAERSALKTLWPSSRLLLCSFHVLQKEWGWLHETKNMVLKEKRLPLMRMFQTVVYAADEVNLNEATSNILNLKDEFPNFVKRFESYFKRKNEWVLMFRRDIITRGNNTNNYAEACIRILKEIILNRTKAYNVVALVEFICYVWEDYLILRILDHAHNRRDNIQRNYTKLCSRTSNFNIDQVTKISETCYSVPSSDTENSAVYTIDIQIGVCDCYVGFTGAFCKHQAFLHKHFNLSLPNAPPITVTERYALGQLALEEFEHSNIDYVAHASNQIESFPRSEDISNKNHTNILQSFIADDKVANNKVNDELEKEFLRFKEFLNDVPLDIRQKLTKNLNVIKNAQQLTKLMVTCSRGLSVATKRKRQIKVQPTSISRRRQGVTRGSRRIPAGRPPKSVPQNKVAKKKHNIGKNISLGQSNAKSHGRGH
ncbi:unnamed protein product [Macrosiphum euphorbiae]|uniref:SWIM-type domain-containing protein n=1 Tax=Macrosiphum euphorbiae TaxID=13131 RepID=A0AAV0XNQ2_9HEMI|nr:unnamed protein product [Macrosiphum euphorbiae]